MKTLSSALPANPKRSKKGIATWLDSHLPVVFLLPAILVMVLVFLYPVLDNVYLSFYDWTFLTLHDPPFVGLSHIKHVLLDPGFYSSMGRSGIFIFCGVGLQFVIGFALAAAVSRIKKGHGAITTMFVFPMMVTPVVVGLIWKFIFDYNFGILNYLFTVVGLPKVALLNSSSFALLSTILVDTWQWTPFMFIVLLAGLKSLPSEPFEAAVMDGASRWQILRHVTLPLMKSVIIVSLVMRIAGALKVFDQIFVLTGGGPGTATETVSIMLHRKAFVEFDFGYSAALALILTVIVGILCWFAIKALYSEK